MDASQEAQDVNRRILEVLRGLADSNNAFTFVCECGCLSFVQMSVAAYETAGGAFADGHPAPADAQA